MGWGNSSTDNNRYEIALIPPPQPFVKCIQMFKVLDKHFVIGILTTILQGRSVLFTLLQRGRLRLKNRAYLQPSSNILAEVRLRIGAFLNCSKVSQSPCYTRLSTKSGYWSILTARERSTMSGGASGIFQPYCMKSF